MPGTLLIETLKKFIHAILTATIALAFGACATLFNAQQTAVTIVTSEPAGLKVDNDSIKQPDTSRLVMVLRQNKPLAVTVWNDSLVKTVQIAPVNSFAYWSNIGFCYGLGMLIDKDDPKRYSYPKTIYLDMSNNEANYLDYNPDGRHRHLLKFTPMKLAGLANPSFELGYEHKTGKRYSTQLMAGYLLPNSIFDMSSTVLPEAKGFTLSAEERFYFKKPAPFGPYLALEFHYLKSRYKDVWNFGVANIFADTLHGYNNYADTFGVRKQTFSYSFKIGYQYIKDRFSVDVFAGLGLRYKMIKHTDRIKPEDEMEIPRHPNFYYITHREGNFMTVSMPLNIRIGYTF